VGREWDLATRAFVADGFTVPEAKTRVSWIDLDSLYVGTDFGAGSLTDAGYPRTSRRWQRGTPLAEAEVVFEGRQDDVSAGAWCDKTPGYVRHFAWRSPDFYTSQEFVRTQDGSYTLIDVPDDADTAVRREWLLIRPRTLWMVDGVEHQPGSLLAARFDDWMAGDLTLSVLFEPDGNTSLTSWTWTRNYLILALLSDVKTVLRVLAPHDGWRAETLPDVPQAAKATIVDSDPDNSDEYFLDTQSFTEPATLRRGVIGARAEVLRAAPSRFDAEGVEVSQYFTKSEDDTRVPYFVVGRPDAATRQVLMTGYGGFEISLTPSYSGIIGHGWIERGGTYVVANIRGGGEYGPSWHQAALRERRPRAYEDFAAVARDLVERGITTPGRLGIRGGSNGGLLMGNMLVSYPELFGAIVCEVPLLDMRRYHLLPAGASWMAEWGDPDDPKDWAYLRNYSPYHLVRPDGVYPPVLLMTSTRDDRVHPGHARKMVARMLQYGLDVRYFENVEGGHAGAADNEQTAVKWALALEFLWQQLEQ
jgi:prolyl oligopeptidase